eukprot:CAMPEP_0172158618 /NCGR_PEP_ID=MMETSP1050-20130122/4477_1 /TAXON_ID=233186 /ORGANISM="Cryptomonas curvata, Strain CCAP979/52" /LENGTH=159 /DNA_ID=CAMNT_0012828039 /DNA_START=164 /DNA_END=643 /DNA_ORIENTATION=-
MPPPLRRPVRALGAGEEALVGEGGAGQLHLDAAAEVGYDALHGGPEHGRALRLHGLVLGGRAVELLEGPVRLVASGVGVDDVAAWGGHARVQHRGDGDDDHVARRVDAHLPVVDDGVVDVQRPQPNRCIVNGSPLSPPLLGLASSAAFLRRCASRRVHK